MGHGRLVRVLAPGVLLSLMSLNLHAPQVLAACQPDDEACLEQDGANESNIDVDNDGEGGDAIAGSQVISVTGSGDVNITANNSSKYAKAQGGDVEANVKINVDNGPELKVTGGSGGAASSAEGLAVTSQLADPQVSVTLDQTGFATGEAVFTGAGLAAGFATGTSVLSQTLGAGASSVGSNAAFITGSAPVTQAATSISTPIAVAIGDAAAASANSVATTQQAAGPSVTINVGQIAFPSGSSIVSNGGGTAAVGLRASNTFNGTGDPLFQSITQTGSSTGTNSVTPVVNVVAGNTASITGTAPVTQAATAVSAPVATAFAPFSDGVSGRLFQLGDNEVGVDMSGELVAGDGVAGSNLIGAAGTGDTSIDATNSSGFAISDGGDVETDALLDVLSGPDLTVLGGTAASRAANAYTATTLNAVSIAAALGGPLPDVLIGAQP